MAHEYTVTFRTREPITAQIQGNGGIVRSDRRLRWVMRERVEEWNVRSALPLAKAKSGQDAFMLGYASAAVAMPHPVYLEEGLRKEWLRSWDAAAQNKGCVYAREAALCCGDGMVAHGEWMLVKYAGNITMWTDDDSPDPSKRGTTFSVSEVKAVHRDGELVWPLPEEP